MSARREARLWVVQRATALVLAVCVAVHLVTIIYAVRHGLSAGAILARTRGSIGWVVLYGFFVAAAAAHGSIGLRTIALEWLRLRGRAADILMGIIAIGLVALGARAVMAIA
jgi:fumarate reductase subunit C